MKKLLFTLFASAIAIQSFAQTTESEVPPPGSFELQAMINNIVASYELSETEQLCMQIEKENEYKNTNCWMACGSFFECRMVFLEIQMKISNLVRHSRETHDVD
jgi:hypothetical protein